MARKDLPRAEDTSDLDRVEVCEKRSVKRKVLSLPGEEDSEVDNSTSFKKPIKKKTSMPLKKPLKPNFHFSNSLTLDTNPLINSSQPTSSNQLRKIASSHSDLNFSSPLFPTDCSSKNRDSTVLEQMVKFNEMMEDMSKRIIEMSKQINSMESKLDALSACKENCKDEEQGIDLSEVLPLKRMEEFVQLDQLLIEDPSFKKKMVKFLSFCGGRDLQKTSNNIMSRLIVDELATCYSLTGKSTKGLIKHAFASTRVWQIVLQTCQKLIKDATIDKVKECVGNWLHQSKTRIIRRAPAIEDIIGNDGL